MKNNFIVNIQNVFFFKTLEKSLVGCTTVLDVGCGNNSAIGYIKKNFTSEGIDIYEDALKLSKSKRLHDSYKKGDIKNLDKYYKNKSFDAVVAIDVIEHLNKNEALKMITKMEDAYDGNPYQIHKSGWNKHDLEKLGFKIFGLRGLKILRTNHAGIKHKPYIIFGFLTLISEVIFHHFPQCCFDIFAVLNVDQ